MVLVYVNYSIQLLTLLLSASKVTVDFFMWKENVSNQNIIVNAKKNTISQLLLSRASAGFNPTAVIASLAFPSLMIRTFLANSPALFTASCEQV